LHRTASAKTTTCGFVAVRQSSILAESLSHPHLQTAKNLSTPMCLKISSFQFGAESHHSAIADTIYTIRRSPAEFFDGVSEVNQRPLSKILSEVTPAPHQSDGAVHLLCRWARQPYGQSPLAITFGNAGEIGKRLV